MQACFDRMIQALAGSTPGKALRPVTRDPCASIRGPPYGLTIASAPTAFSNFKDDDGAQAMLFRSEDEGESWRSLCDRAHTPSHANIHGLTPDPDTPGGVLIGTDTGEVWRVSNDAAWTQIGSGMPVVLSIAAF